MAKLPPFVAYPSASWRRSLTAQEWETLQSAWYSLAQIYLGLSDADFQKALKDSDSSVEFVSSVVHEASSSGDSHQPPPALLKAVFLLFSRIIRLKPTSALLDFSFLADLVKVYPKRVTTPVLSYAFAAQPTAIEASLTTLKKTLIRELDVGIKGDLKLAESLLAPLNSLLHASPHTCTFFLAGSDFFDALVVGYRVMNPPLRNVILTTVYLCLIGLTEISPPKWSMLNDELFSLKTAADTHKQGPLNVNDSLVPELVTSTPILKVLFRRAEAAGTVTDNLKKRMDALAPFKKGAMIRPKRLVRRKVDKGKGKETHQDIQADMHIHRMSQITQVQDLFPDLGAGFVSKCLDEYRDDVEQVVANLLGESLPPHLASADRNEPLYVFFFFFAVIIYTPSFLLTFPQILARSTTTHRSCASLPTTATTYTQKCL